MKSIITGLRYGLLIAALGWGNCHSVCAQVTFLNSWGSYGTGDGQFGGPGLVAVSPSGQVYVGDTTYDSRIQRFDAAGHFQLGWGARGNGNGLIESMGGLAIGSDGKVYASDSFDNRIERFSDSGTFELQWGSSGTLPGQFNRVKGLAVTPNGQILAVQYQDSRLQRFSPDGTYLGGWAISSQTEAIAVNQSTGQVYVASPVRIQRFSSQGGVETTWGTFGHGNGEFWGTPTVAVSANGLVYATDSNNNRVQRFDADGNYQAQWGSQGLGDAQFSLPRGIAVSPLGMVYVIDNRDRVQRFFDPAAWVTGNNAFTDPTVGPTSLAFNTQLKLNSSKTLAIGDQLTIQNGGSIELTSGTLITGDLTIEAGGQLAFVLSNHSTAQVQILGDSHLGAGTLAISLAAGFSPSLNSHWQLFAGGPGDAFGTVSLPPLAGGLSWDQSQLHTTGLLSVVPEPSTLGLAGLAAALLVGAHYRPRTRRRE